MGAETHVPVSPLMLALRAAVAYATHTYGIAAVRYIVHVFDTTTDNGMRKITAHVIREDQVHNYHQTIGVLDAVSWQASLAALATYDAQTFVLVCWHMPEGRMVCTYRKAQLPPPQNVLDYLAA